jgi:Tfp pilus assembly protein PilZ
VQTRLLVRYGRSPGERTGYVESISEGGLYISTNDIYKVGTRLTLEIELPAATVSQIGEVVWAIRVPEHLREHLVCGMGISFVYTDAEWPRIFRQWKASMAQSLAQARR